MLQDNLVLYFMTKANIKRYVNDTEILVMKKHNFKVCYNSFLRFKVSGYLNVGLVNFSVLVQVTAQFCVKALPGCSLPSAFQHILHLHLSATTHCHLKVPKDEGVWLLIYNLVHGKSQEKAIDISW